MFSCPTNRGYLKTRSIFGSVGGFVREVRFPIGIHLLALLIELAVGRKLVFAHLWGGL